MLLALLLARWNPSDPVSTAVPPEAPPASEATKSATPMTVALSEGGRPRSAVGPRAEGSDAADLVRRLHSARSLEELLAAAEQLPPDDADANWALEGASARCMHLGRDAAVAFTSLAADGFLPDDAETRARYLDWRARLDRYCGNSALQLAAALERSRAARAAQGDDAFERLIAERDALDVLSASAGAQEAGPQPLDDATALALVAELANTPSVERFRIAADRLAHAESGPFAPGTAGFAHIEDPARHHALLTAAVKLAACEWSGACHEQSLWMLGACGTVQYCAGGWNYPNYFSRRFGDDDLERIRALAVRLNQLRGTGDARG